MPLTSNGLPLQDHGAPPKMSLSHLDDIFTEVTCEVSDKARRVSTNAWPERKSLCALGRLEVSIKMARVMRREWKGPQPGNSRGAAPNSLALGMVCLGGVGADRKVVLICIMNYVCLQSILVPWTVPESNANIKISLMKAWLLVHLCHLLFQFTLEVGVGTKWYLYSICEVNYLFSDNTCNLGY